jgi:hypothetical protein
MKIRFSDGAAPGCEHNIPIRPERWRTEGIVHFKIVNNFLRFYPVKLQSFAGLSKREDTADATRGLKSEKTGKSGKSFLPASMPNTSERFAAARSISAYELPLLAFQSHLR